MLVKKLKFNPHVVWADADGFHVFGYGNRHYHYLTPDGKSHSWVRNAYGEAFAGIHHFNKVVIGTPPVGCEARYELVHHSVLGVLEKRAGVINLAYFHSQHQVFQKMFWAQFTRPIVENEAGKVITQIPHTANYDSHGDSRVFAWGNTFAFEHGRVGRPYRFGVPYNRDEGHVSCNDAKFSPNGSQVAIAVKDGIKFVSTESLIHQVKCEDLEKLKVNGIVTGFDGKLLKVDRELSSKMNIHFLAYSLDGCTLAAITTCRNLVIWDMDL